MKYINRGAILVKPKQPYCDWARHIDADAEAQHPDGDEGTTYLLPECDDEEHFQRVLKRSYRMIFENELCAWVTDETMWPARRDFRTFRDWFTIEYTSMVVDLGLTALRQEEM